MSEKNKYDQSDALGRTQGAFISKMYILWYLVYILQGSVILGHPVVRRKATFRFESAVKQLLFQETTHANIISWFPGWAM